MEIKRQIQVYNKAQIKVLGTMNLILDNLINLEEDLKYKTNNKWVLMISLVIQHQVVDRNNQIIMIY